MRLRLFDRIRRLAHPRRPPADAAGVSGAQGRHRRGQARGPATAPGSMSFPDGRGSVVARPANWRIPPHPGRTAHRYQKHRSREVPGRRPGDPAGLRPDPRVSGTRRDAGASAVRAGAARARIRAAPQDAAAVGLGGAAGPVPAAPGPRTRRYEAAEPSLAQSPDGPAGYPGGRAYPGRGRRPAAA